MTMASEILTGLRDLCRERKTLNGSPYLTDSEFGLIDAALEELGPPGMGGAREWHDSLKRCLFDPVSAEHL
ncbi:hypothetical protein [Mycolicibacterium aubagnense]|uniref:hypothetical protein n=1 Tax=Mycolicibacterium aubagnense TaxID=319707 RepID=UPI0010FD7BB1|nr:hypothetical protein [Mycolicibacterium aubagnense]